MPATPRDECGTQQLASDNPRGLAARSRPLRVGTHKFAETLFVHPAGGKFKDGPRRRLLARREAIAIQFEKQYADNKAGALVPSTKG